MIIQASPYAVTRVQWFSSVPLLVGSGRVRGDGRAGGTGVALAHADVAFGLAANIILNERTVWSGSIEDSFL